ncbi:hypothetical protein Tsubulata_050366, partial [Turnera subulata]
QNHLTEGKYDRKTVESEAKCYHVIFSRTSKATVTFSKEHAQTSLTPGSKDCAFFLCFPQVDFLLY